MTILLGMTTAPQHNMTYKTECDTKLYNVQRSPNNDVLLNQHDALKVVDTCVLKDGVRYYKICWKESWEREDSLRGFDKLIRNFWEDLENKRNSDRMDVENNNEISSKMTSPDYEDVTTKSPSPPLNITSGRRKGRPKKLLNYNFGEHSPIETKDGSREENFDYHTENVDFDRGKNNFEERQENNFPAYIPRRDVVSKSTDKRNSVEEYPVMILTENNEGSTSHQHVSEANTTVIASHNYSSNSSRFIDEPSMKAEHARTTITSPGVGDKRPLHCSSSRDAIPNKKYSFSTSQIFMGRQLDHSPNKTHTPQHIPVLKPIEHIQEKNLHPYYTDIKEKNQSLNTNRTLHPLKLERTPVIEHTQRHLERLTSTSQLLLTVTSSGNKTTPSVLATEKKNTHSSSLSKGSHNNLHEKHENKHIELPGKFTKPVIKGKTPTLYQVTADGEQRPQCAECFQTFKKRAALERHMMIHRGIKPFQCHFCNQRFRQKHHLQGHIMLHTGERPHSCGLCSKRFRMRHHLLEHERISHKLFR